MIETVVYAARCRLRLRLGGSGEGSRLAVCGTTAQQVWDGYGNGDRAHHISTIVQAASGLVGARRGPSAQALARSLGAAQRFHLCGTHTITIIVNR
jgi:hypothetical protein